MQTIQFQIPDDVLARLEKFITAQGADYASVNTDLTGRDALLTDLMVLGLDEIDAGEDEYPDDVED